jgi:hypothetical protein
VSLGSLAHPGRDIYSLGATVVALNQGMIVNWPVDRKDGLAVIIENMVWPEPDQRWTAAHICLGMGISVGI